MNPTLTLNEQGIVTCEEWKLQGQYHRVDGPSYRAWKVVEGGVAVLTYEVWCLQGKLHRVDGPARRVWEVVNGSHSILIREEWRKQGKWHRTDGPAWRDWTIVNGVSILTREEWMSEDSLHRVDGPAMNQWETLNRSVITEVWYLNGVRVDPAELHQAVSTITHWLRYHSKRRERVISSLLTRAGMTVFPGLMGLLRLH